jgi:hypothetical protein
MMSDSLPFEFLTQLEASLDVDRQTALATLGDWLLSYEPITRRSIEFPSEPATTLMPAPNLRRVA